MHKRIHGLTPAAERLLLNARWDGNIRELKNVVERACMLTDATLLSERELVGRVRARHPGVQRARRRKPSCAPRRPATRPAPLEARSSASTFSTSCGR